MIFLYILWFIILATIIAAMIHLLGHIIGEELETDFNPPFYTKDNWYHVLNPTADDTSIDSSELDDQWHNED